MKKKPTAMMRVVQLKRRDDGQIEYGLKHPSEYTYLVPNEDSYYELTRNEIDESFIIICESKVIDIQNVLKLAFNKATK